MKDYVKPHLIEEFRVKMDISRVWWYINLEIITVTIIYGNIIQLCLGPCPTVQESPDEIHPTCNDVWCY